MRIDTIPSSAVPITERESAKAEGDPNQGGNAFFALIDQMTEPAVQSMPAFEEASSAEGEARNDTGQSSTPATPPTTAPISDWQQVFSASILRAPNAALASAEGEARNDTGQSSAPATPPTTAPIFAWQRVFAASILHAPIAALANQIANLSSGPGHVNPDGSAEARNDSLTANSAQPSPEADSSPAAVGTEVQVVLPEGLSKTLSEQAIDVVSDAGMFVFPEAGEPGGVQNSSLSAPSGDAAPPETHLPITREFSAQPQMDVTPIEPVSNADVESSMPPPAQMSDASIPAELGAALEFSAPTDKMYLDLQGPGKAAAEPVETPSKQNPAADRQAPEDAEIESIRAVAALACESAMPADVISDRRSQRKTETGAGAPGARLPQRRGQSSDYAQISSRVLPEAVDSHRATTSAVSNPAILDEYAENTDLSDSPDWLPLDARPGKTAPTQGRSAERAVTQADAAESAWVDMPYAQQALYHSQPVRAEVPESMVIGAWRPWQQGAGSTSTVSVAGSQAVPHDAAAELKALSALLAPKHAATIQEPHFLSQLAERLQAQLRNGENILRIQLKPSTLGRMEIKAETSGSGVLATILTESAGVKSYLENNLHILQQSFQDQGLKVDRINIAILEGSWPQQSASGQHQSRPNAGEQGDPDTGIWHGGRSGGSGDEIAIDAQTLVALGPHSTFHTVA